jgi:hypothetical protein
MGVRTSAIFYRRGVPNNFNNFAFISQANNTVVVPMHKYLKTYQFYNRNILNPRAYNSLPWNN